MRFRLCLIAVVSFSQFFPTTSVSASPLDFPKSYGANLLFQHHADVMVVASNKKNKKTSVNPKNGDVLIGRVPSSTQKKRSNSRQAQSGGADLGALIGAAVGNYMLGKAMSGGRTRGAVTGPNEVPMGGRGQIFGVRYGTDTPTSPAC